MEQKPMDTFCPRDGVNVTINEGPDDLALKKGDLFKKYCFIQNSCKVYIRYIETLWICLNYSLIYWLMNEWIIYSFCIKQMNMKSYDLLAKSGEQGLIYSSYIYSFS